MNINPFIFREYDIRGIVEKDLTDEVVELIGKAFGTFLQRQGGKKVSVGGDVRLSTERFRQALVRGLISTGADVVDLGLVPTPVLYYSLYKLSVDGGVMITGSHNPSEFNGFKMSVGQSSIYGQDIQKLKTIIEKEDFIKGKGTSKQLDILDDYIKDITNRINIPKKATVVFDCGNGTSSVVIEELMRNLGVNAYFMYCEPDGTFPNHHPDPTVEEYLKDLKDQVFKLKADMGIAFDGDADRIGVIDDKGDIIWGDRC